jgi:hypothetical protein
LIPEPENLQVITTTALALVVGTTIIFGSSMPMVQKVLVPPVEAEAHEYDEDGEATQERDKKINHSDSKGEIKHSEYEEFIHPNMRSSEYQD